MADGIELNAGTGGAVLATDDIGPGVHYQIVKHAFGALDTATLVTAAAGLPVAVVGSVTVADGGGALTVDGTVAVSGTVAVDGSGVTQPVSGPLTDTQLRATPVPVSGTVAVTNAGITTIAGAVAGTEMQVDVLTLPNVTIGAAVPAGNNNIGDVDVASIAAGDNNIGNVDIASAIPAGTNLVGKVSAGMDTASIYSGATALTPKWAVINCNTSGNNTIVAAVADKKIRVIQAFMVSAGTVAVRFESGADGTALTGQMPLVANSGFVLPFSPVGWCETGSNTLLNLELSAAVYVHGNVCYVEV